MGWSKSDLSPFEWEIMNVIWEMDAKPTITEVLDKAYPNGERAYTTIHTVMKNLEKKGFLKKEKIGMVYFFEPVKKKNDVLLKETDTFARQVFGGTPSDMAKFLVGSNKLSKRDINELKRLITKIESETSDDTHD